jgi:hypothetical protein
MRSRMLARPRMYCGSRLCSGFRGCARLDSPFQCYCDSKYRWSIHNCVQRPLHNNKDIIVEQRQYHNRLTGATRGALATRSTRPQAASRKAAKGKAARAKRACERRGVKHVKATPTDHHHVNADLTSPHPALRSRRRRLSIPLAHHNSHLA